MWMEGWNASETVVDFYAPCVKAKLEKHIALEKRATKDGTDGRRLRPNATNDAAIQLRY